MGSCESDDVWTGVGHNEVGVRLLLSAWVGFGFTVMEEVVASRVFFEGEICGDF